MATLQNPWTNVDEEKAAAWASLTPQDQRWLGNGNPLDQQTLVNAPNRGQTVDNIAQAESIGAAFRDSGPGIMSVGDIASLANSALDNVADQVPPQPETVLEGTTSPGVFNGTVPFDSNSTEPIFVEILPPASTGDGGTQPTNGEVPGSNGASSPQGGMDYLFQQSQKTVEQSFIYKATKVVSKFSKGMFTQELSGAIVTFEEALAQAALARNAALGEEQAITAYDVDRSGDTQRVGVSTSTETYDDAILRQARLQGQGTDASLNPTEYSAYGNYLGAATGAVPAEYLNGTQTRTTSTPSAGPDDGFRGFSSVGPARSAPVTSNNQVIDSAYGNYLGAATGGVPAEYLNNQNIAREE